MLETLIVRKTYSEVLTITSQCNVVLLVSSPDFVSKLTYAPSGNICVQTSCERYHGLCQIQFLFEHIYTRKLIYLSILIFDECNLKTWHFSLSTRGTRKRKGILKVHQQLGSERKFSRDQLYSLDTVTQLTSVSPC